jgi:fucose permease
MEFPLHWPPNYLQLFLVIALPIMGLVYALLGGLKLSLADRLRLDEGKVGGLVAGFGMMVGPIIMACGFVTDLVGRKEVWLVGCALVAAAIFVMASARTFGAALVGVLLLGAGWSATVNVANVLMRVGEVDPARMTKITNFYDFVFGFGAFVTPMVLALLLRRLGYARGLCLLGIVALVPLGMGWFAEMNPPGPAAPAGAPATFGELLSSKAFWLLGLAFLFYVPLESAVAGWATTLVVHQKPPGAPEAATRRLAAAALSGFWLCFMGSRLIVSLVGVGGKELEVLQVFSLACLVLTLGIVFLRGRFTAAAVVVIAGLLFGPVFPTMMAMLLTSVGEKAMGRAVGIFFFFGSIGWTVIPMLIGQVARRTNIQRGFLVTAGSAAVFVAFVAVRWIGIA